MCIVVLFLTFTKRSMSIYHTDIKCRTLLEKMLANLFVQMSLIQTEKNYKCQYVNRKKSVFKKMFKFFPRHFLVEQRLKIRKTIKCTFDGFLILNAQ